jgi:hypothetical protein
VAPLDRVSVLNWLRSLPEEEFAHLLAEACQSGAYRHYDVTDVRYAAAHVWRDGDEPWTVDLIAPEDAARYQGTPFEAGFPSDDPIIRSAECPVCGLRVCSWARWVRCPVCGEELSCS